MNQRNVDALVRRLQFVASLEVPEEFRIWGWNADALLNSGPFCYWFAQHLAQRTALIPSALTLGDCARVDRESHDPHDGALIETEMVAALERLAKGDS